MSGVALFQTGDFVLASGQRSSWKIECDALTEDDWRGLAAMLVDRLPPFGVVEGVPRGGLPLADALRPFGLPAHADMPLLIVDDVWTTGGSMHRHLAAMARYGLPVLGAVVFARGPVEPWVTALFQMDAR